MAVESRRYIQEIGKVNQDLVFSSHLHFHRQHQRLKEVYNDQVRKEYGQSVEANMSWRSDTLYLFRGAYICKKMFMFLHDIGDKRHRNSHSAL